MRKLILIYLMFQSFLCYCQDATIQEKCEFVSQFVIKKGNNITARGVNKKSYKDAMFKSLRSNAYGIRDSSYYWFWDTMINNWSVIPFSKTVNYVYNSNNRITDLLDMNWNGTDWINSAEWHYVYDANNNNTQDYHLYWNGSSWVNGSKYVYTYDSNNNNLSYLHQEGNGTNWINQEQEIYSYNSNNKLVNIIWKVWDGTSWLNDFKTNVFYNSNNKDSLSIGEIWNAGSWEPASKTTYKYSLNNLIASVGENWNGSGWDSSSVSTYTYDANNNEIGYIMKIWNGDSWNNQIMKNENYNSFNKLIDATSYTWNGFSWENSYRVSYEWNFNNTYVVHHINEQWDVDIWKKKNENRYYYDNNDILFSEVHKSWDLSGEVTLNSDSAYYFLNSLTSIKEIKRNNENLNIFPNPASSSLSISTEINYNKVNILNSFGQIIYSNDGKSKTISIANLGSGIYFIQLLNKQAKILTTEKFIKE